MCAIIIAAIAYFPMNVKIKNALRMTTKHRVMNMSAIVDIIG
jgi:hypothetical protein